MSMVRHPAFPDVVKDVDDVARWVAAGWIPVDDDLLPPGPNVARNGTGEPEILEAPKPKRRGKPRGKGE